MENRNSVCYVGKIGSIIEIPGADNIELVLAGGWQALTKKGEYRVNDLVVIAITDAVIPRDLSDRMEVTNYLRKGQRVRTVKLRGVYSECLLIPTKYIPGLGDIYYEGMDMMEKMKIYKYDPPAKMITLVSGDRRIKYHQNPNFGVYYKFPNLKNVMGLFTEEDNVQITRKLHGTNARYGIVKKRKLSLWDKLKRFFRIADELIEYEYVYGSHNVEKGSDSQGFYDTNVWREVAEQYDIKSKLKEFALTLHKEKRLGAGFVLYGEIYGAGIQKNYDYGLTDIKFAGFDVVIDGKYEGTIYTEWVLGIIIKLPHVPILYVGPWSQTIQDQFVFNNFIEGTKVPHEGIVIKHVSGDRKKVAKVINPDYLIYGEKHDVGDSH